MPFVNDVLRACPLPGEESTLQAHEFISRFTMDPIDEVQVYFSVPRQILAGTKTIKSFNDFAELWFSWG